MNAKSPIAPVRNRLTCPECANTHRFIQVMAEEINLVDGTLKHIHLIEGIVDHYICWKCGVSIQTETTAAT